MRITLTFTRGFWWWKRTYTRTFEGECTVWHDIKTGRRPGTVIEGRLSEIEWLRNQTGSQEVV